MRIVYATRSVLAFAGLAVGQYPPGQYGPTQYPALQNPTQPFPGLGPTFGSYGPSGNPYVMPNIFNPQAQPLSPYLNLLRGGNTATNYYYGVRPGTIGLSPRGFGGAPFVAPGGNRMLFFPQLAAAPEPLGAGGPGTEPETVLPPAGHPVVFGNTLGFFPSPFGQAGGSRPGLGGLGTTRAPTKK